MLLRAYPNIYYRTNKTDLEWSVLLCKIVSRNPLPVARRYSGDCWLGSSPGSGSSRLQTFPEPFFQWYLLKQLSHYSGGTAPVLHRTSLLSPHGHLNPLYAVFFTNLNTSSFVLFVKSFFVVQQTSSVCALLIWRQSLIDLCTSACLRYSIA